MSEPPKHPRPRPLPSNDPMWIASRFAWLYATIDGLLAVLLALIGFAAMEIRQASMREAGIRFAGPCLLATALAVAMGVLAGRIKQGDRYALKVAVMIAGADAFTSIVLTAFVALRNPVLALPSVLPIGIRIVFVLSFLKPLRSPSGPPPEEGTSEPGAE